MSALDIILLVIIGGAILSAILYIIKKGKSGACIGCSECSECSGCRKACMMHEKCCGSDKSNNLDIHIKRSSL